MKKYQLGGRPSSTLGINIDAATAKWKDSEFYAEAVVLGIDIGLDGIGVCLRRGPEILHAATWMIPWPESLADRRAKRAWRHCRKNLKVRISRLRKLFEIHDLPWFEDRSPQLLHADPFELRYKAISRGVDSKEELALAIRHVVAHRGHHYNYYNDEGEYPWGDVNDFKAACQAIESQFLTVEEANKFTEDCASFGWTDDKVAKFRALVESRKASGSEIADYLASYCSENRRNLRRSPKGVAFPRLLVWRHLEEIVRKNSRFLSDSERLLRELGIRPDIDKDRAIFFYHRKTPQEMQQHFEQKTKRCVHARWLGLGDDLPCDTREIFEIRRFLLLEFLATRRIEIGPPSARINLPADVIEKLLGWQENVERTDASQRHGWREARKFFEAALKDAGVGALVKKSPFNEDFLDHLKDLLCPTPANRKKKSSLSAIAAGNLYTLATSNGFNPASIVRLLGDYYKRRREAVLDPSGRYPQVDFLLGAVARRDRKPTRRHPNRKRKGEAASQGKLQQLFARHADKLSGKTCPDYCVIEVIADPPRTKNAKDELQRAMQKRRLEHEARLATLPAEIRTSRTLRLRLKLFDQQRGRSPFSGVALGDNPQAADLQICHLFPDSKGGLFTEENLVLAPRAENVLMENRTPRQAASTLAGSWEKMQSFTADMKWSNLKREIFSWDADGVPDFGNTTRMSQLARQLYVSVGSWMGLREIDDPVLRENRRQERIGTPSGFITSVARAAWKLPKKDRTDLLHHAIDAIALAWIPPGVGMNSVRHGGILYDEYRPQERKTRLSMLPLGPDPTVVDTLASDTSNECPVVHFRRSSTKSQMHDTTILGVRRDGKLASREPFDSKKEKIDLVTLRHRLLHAGVPVNRIPTDRQLDAWLADSGKTPLRLRDGQVIRRRVKEATKASTLFPGLGLVGRAGAPSGWQGLRIIGSKYDGVELWKVYNSRRSQWNFLLRRIPDKRAMECLLRLAFSWLDAVENQNPAAPAELLNDLKKTRRSLNLHKVRWIRLSRGTPAADLLRKFVEAGFPIDGAGPRQWEEVEQAIYGDVIPAGAVRILDDSGRPAIVRNGQTFRIPVTPDGKFAESRRPFERHWFRVSAVNSDGRVAFAPLRRMDWKKLPLSRENLVSLFGHRRDDDPPSDPGR